MGSGGASKAVAGDRSLHRQAITSLKPGGGATSCTASRGLGGDADSGIVSSTCWCSSTLQCWALLPAVRPPSQLTGDCRDQSSSSNQLGGMQHFSPPREPSWGSLYLHFSLLTWYLGSTWFLKRFPNWGFFLHGGLFNGRAGGGQLGTPGLVVLGWSSRNPSGGATPPRMASWKKEMYSSITSLNSRMLPAKRCGWPSVGGLDFSTQYWRACA